MESVGPPPSDQLSGKDETELRSRALKICQDHLGDPWTRITSGEMSFKSIKGGMSNALYCCSLPNSMMPGDCSSRALAPAQVLLRFYGDELKNSLERQEIQMRIFEMLAEKDLGPKLYGKFDDGRLEEFLPSRSLLNEELWDLEISSVIAKKLAIIHQFEYLEIEKTNCWLKEKLEEWLEFVTMKRSNHSELQEFLFKQQHSSSNNSDTTNIAKQLMGIDFRQEVEFLIELLKLSKAPIVFSHNDLHHGNILLVDESVTRTKLFDRIVLIDFEFCSYNYREFDIANHLSEWCFHFDNPTYPHFTFFKDRFPSEQQQRQFLKHYLKATPTSSKTHKAEKETIKTNGNKTNEENCGRDEEEFQIDIFFDAMQPFLMASNLLWTLWAIKSAFTSKIEFGYWEMAKCKWELYLFCKEKFQKRTNKLTC